MPTPRELIQFQEEIDKALANLNPRRPIVFMPNDSTGASSFRYITHARTLDELRQEFLSDIKRRLAQLDAQMRFDRSKTGHAKIAYATRELEEMARFWQEVEIARDKRRTTT